MMSSRMSHGQPYPITHPPSAPTSPSGWPQGIWATLLVPSGMSLPLAASSWRPSRRQRRHHLRGADHRGLTRENLLHQQLVDFRVPVGAPILHHYQVVVQVGGLPHGGQDDPAGGVTHEDDGLNVLGPQDGFKRA